MSCSEQKEGTNEKAKIVSTKCKIENWKESEFKPPTKEVINFLNKETNNLFFRSSTTYDSFVKEFSLSRYLPGDKENHWGDRDDRAFANGKWNGAYVYLSGNTYKGYNGFNGINGPVFLGDGIGQIEAYYSSGSGFPTGIKIYQNLDKKYYANDILNAIRIKIGNKNIKHCFYEGIMGVAGELCNGSGQKLLYKHNERYFKLGITVYAVLDKNIGDNSIENTVILYKVEEFNEKVNNYKKCLSVEKDGKSLKL